mmetsp:Transcript_11226/g.29957  ORF Transcript_11226/g.29957 Transcript_11226/m.29957 type:complete len:360 (-) Transcript_11226:414-1493(-)
MSSFTSSSPKPSGNLPNTQSAGRRQYAKGRPAASRLASPTSKKWPVEPTIPTVTPAAAFSTSFRASAAAACFSAKAAACASGSSSPAASSATAASWPPLPTEASARDPGCGGPYGRSCCAASGRKHRARLRPLKSSGWKTSTGNAVGKKKFSSAHSSGIGVSGTFVSGALLVQSSCSSCCMLQPTSSSSKVTTKREPVRKDCWMASWNMLWQSRRLRWAMAARRTLTPCVSASTRLAAVRQSKALPPRQASAATRGIKPSDWICSNIRTKASFSTSILACRASGRQHSPKAQRKTWILSTSPVAIRALSSLRAFSKMSSHRPLACWKQFRWNLPWWNFPSNRESKRPWPFIVPPTKAPS